jgi:hypothetical protein
VELTGVQFQRALQSFQQSQVFGDIVVLTPNPFADPDAPFLRSFNDYAHAGRPGISERSTINVSHQIKHQLLPTSTNMLKNHMPVKMVGWFAM